MTRRAQLRGLASDFGVLHTSRHASAAGAAFLRTVRLSRSSGRRARRTGQASGLLLSLLAAIVAGFLVTLALAPHLPTIQLQDPRVLQGLHQETAKHVRGSR